MAKSATNVMVGMGTLLMGVAAVVGLFLANRPEPNAQPVPDRVSKAPPDSGKSSTGPKRVETLKLTPDLGSSPIRSGTLVPDGILPAGYGPSGTVLSKPDNIAVNGLTDFKTPDGRGTSHSRAFLTFPMSALPDAAHVNHAHLVVPVTGLSGSDVYAQQVLVEKVDIGQELDKTDYATSGILLGKYTVEQLRSSPGIDVTQGLQAAFLAKTAAFVTIRIRFEYDHSKEYFNNTEGGTLSVQYAD